MFPTFVIIILLALCVGFFKVYDQWKGARPIMFALLIATLTFTGILLGNSGIFSTVPFPIPPLERWATQDALADGPFGASNGIFLFVILGMAFLSSKLLNVMRRHKWLQRPSLATTMMVLTFVTFIMLSAPVGMNLAAMNVDTMSPTQAAAGKIAAAAMDAGATAIVEMSEQLEKPLAQKRSGKKPKKP